MKFIRKLIWILCLFCTFNVVNASNVQTDHNPRTVKTNDKDTVQVENISILNDENARVEIFSPQEMIEEINSDPYLSSEEKISSITSIYASMFNRASSYGYLTLTFDIPVTSTYKPQVKFYTKFLYYNDPAPYKMVNIMNVSLKRDYNGIVKQFSGSIYYNLENGKTLYYIINGDFFNTGTTTVGFGAQIGIGEHSNISFNASNQSNFYAYCYYDERYVAAGLSA